MKELETSAQKNTHYETARNLRNSTGNVGNVKRGLVLGDNINGSDDLVTFLEGKLE